MSDFASLFDRFHWREIRNCSGRYVLTGAGSRLRPDELASGAPAREFRVQGAMDLVVVVRVPGGGIISYKKPDGSYLHTINTIDGFERKLAQLGITLLD